jgi:hypothetical protein
MALARMCRRRGSKALRSCPIEAPEGGTVWSFVSPRFWFTRRGALSQSQSARKQHGSPPTSKSISASSGDASERQRESEKVIAAGQFSPDTAPNASNWPNSRNWPGTCAQVGFNEQAVMHKARATLAFTRLNFLSK